MAVVSRWAYNWFNTSRSLHYPPSPGLPYLRPQMTWRWCLGGRTTGLILLSVYAAPSSPPPIPSYRPFLLTSTDDMAVVSKWAYNWFNTSLSLHYPPSPGLPYLRLQMTWRWCLGGRTTGLILLVVYVAFSYVAAVRQLESLQAVHI